jgi:hypothetical protein
LPLKRTPTSAASSRNLEFIDWLKENKNGGYTNFEASVFVDDFASAGSQRGCDIIFAVQYDEK